MHLLWTNNVRTISWARSSAKAAWNSLGGPRHNIGRGTVRPCARKITVRRDRHVPYDRERVPYCCYLLQVVHRVVMKWMMGVHDDPISQQFRCIDLRD
eukprot:scaffold516_cov175-Amphora_coffeaeformis.AAC.23